MYFLRVTTDPVIWVFPVPTRVMHQDNISSILYKSLKRTLLAGCQDSDQQIICCTVGKSMPYSPVEMSKSSHYPRLASTASSNKRECKVAIHHGESNELQLMKITKEAKKKDDFTYSWQKVTSDRARRSNDTAGDLLRGVTELKESVILLQDESISIDRTRSKSVSKYVDTGTGTNIGTTNARRFQATTHQTISEPPSTFAYLNSYHLTKQAASDDESSLSRWMPGSDHDCTQLSFATAYRSRQERALCLSRQKNGHSPPTLVAKLMGLEAAPSERMQSIKEKTIKNKFIEEGAFIAMSNDRRSLKLEKGSNLGKNGFKELKETALLNGECTDKDHIIASCFHGTSLVGKYGSSCHLGIEAAPIVVMKPMLMRYLEREDSSSGFRFCELSSKERANPTVKPLKLASSQNKKQETVQSSRIKPSSSPSRSYIKKEKMTVTNGLLENGKLTQKTYLERSRVKYNKSTRSVTITISQAKPAPSLPRKPEKMPTLAKYHATSSTRVLKDSLRSPLQHTRSSVKDKKISRPREINARAPDATISVSKCTEDKKVVNSSQRRQSPPQIITSPFTNSVSKGADEASLTSVKGRKKEGTYSSREVMPKPGQSGAENNSPQAETELHDPNILKQTTHEEKDDIKSLLLGNQKFLAHAQQLLHVSPNQHTNHQRQNKNQTETKSYNLILDFSDELLERKTHEKKLLNHPLFRSYSGCSTSRSSLGDLTEGIVVMVQDLRSYTRTAGDSVPSADSLYLRLEKDLRCNLMVGNGGWDWGWIDGFCMEDSDQVVCDLEQLLIRMLVEEILMDHLCC